MTSSIQRVIASFVQTSNSSGPTNINAHKLTRCLDGPRLSPPPCRAETYIHAYVSASYGTRNNAKYHLVQQQCLQSVFLYGFRGFVTPARPSLPRINYGQLRVSTRRSSPACEDRTSNATLLASSKPRGETEEERDERDETQRRA